MTKTDVAEVRSFALNDDPSVPVTAIDALREDGVVCIRQAIGAGWRDVIETGIELALSGASTDMDVVKQNSDSGAFTVSSGAWRQVEPFRRFIFESPLVDMAWALLKTRQLVLFYDFLLIKEAFSGSASTPWHQDHSYYPLLGRKVINCWIALDDIPSESALRFMRASHLPGTLYRAVDFDDPESDYLHARNELPLPAGDDRHLPSTIVTAPVEAGDMLVWTSYTLHSAPGNQLDRRRAAFSVNWVGDDIVYLDRPSLETYRDPGQIPGQPIICDKFPLVRGIQP